jgi:hypothetical protein
MKCYDAHLSVYVSIQSRSFFKAYYFCFFLMFLPIVGNANWNPGPKKYTADRLFCCPASPMSSIQWFRCSLNYWSYVSFSIIIICYLWRQEINVTYLLTYLLLWSRNRIFIVEPEPHNYCGAGTAPLLWSWNRIIIVEPEPHHYCRAGTASLLRSRNRIIIVGPEAQGDAAPVSTLW